MRACGTLTYYVQGFRTAVRIGGGRLRTFATFALYETLQMYVLRPYRCAYYDRSTATVWEQTFDGYYTTCTVAVNKKFTFRLKKTIVLR